MAGQVWSSGGDAAHTAKDETTGAGVALSHDDHLGMLDPFSDLASQAPPKRRRRRRWAYVAGGMALALALSGLGVLYLVDRAKERYNANITRFAAPVIPEAGRPAPAAADAGGKKPLNFLLLGSDSRISAGDPLDWKAGAQRTDAIMLVHVQADRKGAFVISIPRDSWVEIPGRGEAKINAGFSFGGPTLMMQTVESVTDVRLDHMLILDFQGFKDVTDTLGGVKICVPKQVDDIQGTIKKGCQIMDGETALRYVRQRKTLAGGDFDRVKRQQNWIRAVMRKVSDNNMLASPVQLNTALELLTQSMATDEGFTLDDMEEIASSLKDAETNHVKFFTAPVDGTGRSADGQSIVLLDTDKGATLWQAVRDDKVFEWIKEYKPQMLGSTTR
jgi:LCP family protein required for cell wall assembly